MLNEDVIAPASLSPTVDRILAPLTRQDFLGSCWGKRHLVLHRHDPGYYGGFFRFADVDRYLDVAAKSPAAYVLFGQAGKPFRRARVQDTNVRELYKALNEGSTILLDAVERFWPPVADLAAGLSEAFGAKVKVNVYMTPPGLQGAPIHPDVQDVFVLQMEGAKEWYLYDRKVYELVETVEHSLDLDFPRPDLAEEPPLAEHTLLEPGDLLYMPRGLVHRAVAPPDRPSLHLTVCVTPTYWVDFLKVAVETLSAEHPELGRALTPGFQQDPAIRDQMRRELQSLLRLVTEHASFDRTADVLVRGRSRANSNPADGHFEQLMRLDEVGIDTVVEHRRGLVPSVEATAESVTFRCGAGWVKSPATLRRALEFIRDHDRFQVRDLPGASSDEGKLVLVRRLIREGFLRAKLAERSR
jgi:ribosomal protein L16 Arg81 hydroxylase